MKKTFDLNHPKKRRDRMLEAVRRDLKRYVKRERGKSLPEGADFWDFDCRFGHTEGEAAPVELWEFSARLDEAEKLELMSFYVEILAKPGFGKQPKRPAKNAEERLAKDAEETSTPET